MERDFQVIEKHHVVLRICHWVNIPLLCLMVWSGLLIYWANPVYLEIPDELGPFKIHHRLAEGMGWHFFIMWIFFINGAIYLTYCFLSGHWKNLLPKRQDFKDALPYILYDLKIKKIGPEISGKYNPVQKIAYTGAIIFGMGSVITGLAIYKPVQVGCLTALLGGYPAARLEHFIFMLGFNLFLIVHVIQVIRAGWNNFRAMLAGYEIHED